MRQAPFNLAVSAELLEQVDQNVRAAPNSVADSLVSILQGEFRDELVGVVFYGSRLNKTAGQHSDWDFFVVVKSYSGVHSSRVQARLNSLLPPSVYRREVALSDGTKAQCKLSIVSAADLDLYTSTSAPDSYLFGRFSKRVALVHCLDERTHDRIVEAIARSVALCAAWTVAGASSGLRSQDVAQKSVAFSYQCEERVEGPGRALKLFETDAEYFRSVYDSAAAAQQSAGWAEVDPEGLVRRSRTDAESRAERAVVAAFVSRSRRRARLRWLKNIVTFEGWDDYMLAKIARHQDVPLVLSARERRHPVLAAVRHYIRLRRQGRISGARRTPTDPEIR